MIEKIEKVNLREVWMNEANGFTLWLASNLDYLQDAINFNLDPIESEKKLENSRYSIDILASDDDGFDVVIENQLEKSDHTHLGQILTYVINQDASTVIWICKEPRQEHINVINYLNEQTDKNYYFLKVEAFKIGNSKPAPYFSVICSPSEEIKINGAEKKENKIKRDERIRRRKQANCIIVPSQKENFEKLFLGEHQWYAIRMREARISQIKYIAGYQVSPISAVTHLAEVDKIVPYKDSGKYLVKFKGPAVKIDEIKSGDTKIQGPCYVDKDALLQSKSISEAFNLICSSKIKKAA